MLALSLCANLARGQYPVGSTPAPGSSSQAPGAYNPSTGGYHSSTGIAIGAAAVGWLSQIWNLLYVRRALGLAWSEFQAWVDIWALFLVNLGATLVTLAIMPAVPTSWPTMLQLFAGGITYLAAVLVPSLAWSRVWRVYRDLLGVARARGGPLHTSMSGPAP